MSIDTDQRTSSAPKSIIALSCSPSRRRNSDTMLDHFIIGAARAGVSIEKIYLDDIVIDHYRYENRHGPLPHEESFKKLCEKIITADGLVIATPTYNFSVPAHLKNFIDRIRFVALDMSKRNRVGQPVGRLGYLRLFFLVSGGIPTWSEKILFFAFPSFWLRGVFLYYGAQVLGAYYSGDVSAFKNERVLRHCEHKGERYGRQVVAGKKNRILERIFFRPTERE